MKHEKRFPERKFLQRSDLSLASAYLNNIPADETITKRFPSTTEATNEEEVHHRIDITDREYLDTREQAQHKRQSHYKFRIGSGKPVKRAFMERRTEADTEEDEILPAAALPIRRRVLARGEEEDWIWFNQCWWTMEDGLGDLVWNRMAPIIVVVHCLGWVRVWRPSPNSASIERVNDQVRFTTCVPAQVRYFYESMYILYI